MGLPFEALECGEKTAILAEHPVRPGRFAQTAAMA
jgi:hypothetical protein